MNLQNPNHFAIWTDQGRDDHAADLEFVLIGDALKVSVQASKAAVTKIRLRWSQKMPEKARVLGDHWERGYGDLEWRGIVPERVMPWYALIYSEAEGRSIGLGVETGAGSIASWQVDPQGFTLTLDLRNGGSGVELGQRTLHAATVRFLKSDNETPFQFAQRFCKALCSSPRLPGFPAYGGNDWYYAYGSNSDESIRRDTSLIRELSPDRSNAPFMVIDAGWYPAKGCDGGPYQVGNEKFPDMPGLAAWMARQGVRPGIWIRPLLTSDAPETWQMPDNHPVKVRDKGLFLDPSVPEVIDHVRQDISRLREWGYQLIKHDFTIYDITGRWGFENTDGQITPNGWSFADRSRTTAEIIRDLYSAIREAAGEAVLIGCNTIGHLGAGLFEIQRTGDDTSGREWERTRKMGINTLAFRMPQHDAFFAVDADCVGLTNDVPWELNSQWLELLARSGTPLFVSADPKAIGPEQKDALMSAFEIAATPQPIAEPLDWLETTSPAHWKFGNEKRVFKWISDGGSVQ